MFPEALRTFIQHLQEVEYATVGEQFHLSVKYRRDTRVYDERPLPRGDYITESGLRDPGFGSGPVEFEDIEFVAVHAAPRRGECTDEYRQKVAALRDRVRHLAHVSSDQNDLVFKNN